MKPSRRVFVQSRNKFTVESAFFCGEHNQYARMDHLPSKLCSKDLLVTLFNELMAEHSKYRAYIPEITEETVRKVLDKLNMKVKSQLIVNLVLGRYDAIDK